MLSVSRGPLTETVIALMRGDTPPPTEVFVGDALTDDDLHMALYLCYELHYGGLEDIDERMEWDLDLLRFRAGLERRFESALREASRALPTGEPVDVQLRRLIAADDAPSISSYLARHGTVTTYREFMIHRSAYHLREADPHSFGIPRLRGRAKAAMIEIQVDEYGGGDEAWMHSTLFARTMRGLGLDAAEGAYLDELPGITLATMNLMSLFGLHRRLRGALVGHLAVFEMTSCIPNRRYGDGLRRLGFDDDVTRYFDEHVEADAAHGAIAANDMAGSLVRQDPTLEIDVVFGASALIGLEGLWARRLLGSWERDESSLYYSPTILEQLATVG